MNDLFLNLFTYIPTDKVSPIENYLTEILAYLLKKSEKFRKEFLHLCGIAQSEIETIGENDIQTQFYHHDVDIDKSFFDVLIANPSIKIVIENKVDTGFGNGQLKKYRGYLKKSQTKSNWLITITKSIYRDENFGYADSRMSWFEIYAQVLNDALVAKYELEYRDYFYNLKSFLKENEMGGERVSWDISKGLEAEKNLINQIEFAFNSLINEEFKELRTDNMSKAHHKAMGFYACKGIIFENNMGLNIYYVMEKVAIFCETEKKNLRKTEGYNDAFWSSDRVEIDRFDILREHYLGLDLNGQIEKLKIWGRNCIQKFKADSK